MADRLVLEGVLGCPNCRDSFPVVEGFADLRPPPREELEPGLVGSPPARPEPPDGSGGEGEGDAEHAARLVALLGVVGGQGAVALVGGPARLAHRLAAAMPEILLVGVDPDLRRWPETVGMSRLAAGPGLPFSDGTLRAAAVDGRLGSEWLQAVARVVQPRARVVAVDAPPGAAAVLRAAGLRVLAEEEGTVVAARG